MTEDRIDPLNNPLSTFLAVVEAWGRGDATGYEVLDAAETYLAAQELPHER